MVRRVHERPRVCTSGLTVSAAMGRLVVIEGLDGAGKNTLTRRLLDALGARATAVAFPRYDADVHAELARDALHGRLGDLADSVHAMAVLFALDRRAAAEDLRKALAGHDLVLVDRYVASNAAYGAARLHQGADGEFVSWVHDLEIERFGLPVPDRHLLLDVPLAVAAQRAAHRERADPGRPRDRYESDAGLQDRTGAVYRELAAAGWLAPWTVLDGAAGVDVEALSDRLLH